MTNTTRTRTVLRGALALLALLASGCGSASAGAWRETTSTHGLRDDADEGEEGVDVVGPGDAPRAEHMEVSYSIDRFEAQSASEEQRSAASDRGRTAAPEPPPDWGAASERATTPIERIDRLIAQVTPAPATGERAGSTDTASDALAPGRQLLIYTAVLNLAVHHVEDQQNALVAIARAHGGFMARRSGSEVVIRVPAMRFEEALAATEALGDILGRTVDAQDVGEEFRDTQIRLRNLEAMRQRLEELLRLADNIEAALAVEQQLERVTTEIELLRGRLRSLEDRIAYSTITVHFRPRPTAQERVDEFQLPFRWLHRLGLPRLMEVR